MKRSGSPGFLLLMLLMVGTSGWTSPMPQRLVVLPVFFIPTDASISERELRSAADVLQSHLQLAQNKYKALLETDTFPISDRKYNFCHAAHTSAFYDLHGRKKALNAGDQVKPEDMDASHLIVKEILDWNHDNRMDSRTVYLTLFVRPNNQAPGSHSFGGGRTFNGPPNMGGGYVEMEMYSLLYDKPYPFQSTVVHELGHGFGLLHVNCFGYDMSTNGSIMSYNLKHHTKGLQPSAGTFNAEDYFILSQNKLAFPNFSFVESKHNPQHKSLKNVYMGIMHGYIGPFRRVPGKGYELFFNGKQVNGPETVFYALPQARENCGKNAANNKTNAKIECRYDGVRFYP
ncbi:MAG: hypothetical protein ABSE08_05140 [Syntrophobacteraceae bacterium]